MRFAASSYLWLLLGLPVLAALIALSFGRRRRALEAVGDLRLVRRLTTSASLEKRIIKACLVVLSALFLILALARPQWGSRLETVSRRGVDVIVAVDTSRSMLAEDVKPNRLAHARGAVASLIDVLPGDRIGIVAFAGAAYVACPLTLDHTAASIFLDVLDTDLIPIQGTAIAEAIRTATRAFQGGERRHRVLVLITDGEDHEGDVEDAAREAAGEGVTIYAVGIGSPGGEPIPLRNARGEVVGYKEDDEGRKVTSRLDDGALEAIAVATGGKYFRSSAEGIELRRIGEELGGMDSTAMSARLHTLYEERYQWPLAAALLLLSLEALLSGRRREPPATAAGPAEEAA
jgi:Ca-activated chloride channel family protein